MEEDVIDGEADVINESEKKQGKVSGFFKKAKEKLNDATYEARMKSEFNKTHVEYTIHKTASAFSMIISLYAVEYDGYIVAPYEQDDITDEYIIKNNKTNEVFYIDGVEKQQLTFNFEGKENILNGIKISFKENAKSVDVIKVGDKYYLKK